MVTARCAQMNNLIVGLGATGMSCVRYLTRRGQSCVVMDKGQPAADRLEACRELGVQVHAETWSRDLVESADRIWLSPGVPLADPIWQGVRDRITSDVAEFLAERQVPVIGVTGSNGKSTVTAWIEHVASSVGIRCMAAGNIGVPCLEMLDAPADLVVLELSSFQLEMLDCPGLDVAVLLNVSQDHMDRYADMHAYAEAKRRIFRGARVAVFNADDPETRPDPGLQASRLPFGREAGTQGWKVNADSVPATLCHDGLSVLKESDIQLPGLHNLYNAAAVLAVMSARGVTPERCLGALKSFRGLPHRCRKVAEVGGVAWYNDSKGTNVGATLAAVAGVARRSNAVHLLLGGLGKGQDFAPLRSLSAQVSQAWAFGEDAQRIAEAVGDAFPVHCVETLAQAVEGAAREAKPGEAVLLSPACASFDQFKSYADRGESFERLVHIMAGEDVA